MQSVVFLLFRRMRLPLIILIAVYAISVLGLVLVPGADAQGNLWHMSFFHAFYVVSFMGSTIGFGEVPYPFTDAQRLWVTFAIYFTVFAWLFTIGNMLKVIQDPIFRRVINHAAFNRSVKRITKPFYLICGCGDTGGLLVNSLSERGIHTVVIDRDQECISVLELADFPFHIPALCADASEADSLIRAGMTLDNCAGIIAVTNEDHTNLTIAIAAKLLNPSIKVICRAETIDAADNMASFGTDHIVNPFDIFSTQVITAIHSSGMYLLYDWLTCAHHKDVSESISPPRGNWVLCGYGRFGATIYKDLLGEEISTRVIEATPEKTGLPADGITGRGTEASTLLEANVDTANAIIAGTDDDANNLSIIMTAKELNPNLFTIARQNEYRNEQIFNAAKLDVIMKKSDTMSRQILSLITNPLLADFLRLIKYQDDEWANVLISKLAGIIGEHPPELWLISIDSEQAPACMTLLSEGGNLRLGNIFKDPRDHTSNLYCLPLLLKRGMHETLIPPENTAIHAGDKILFAGTETASSLMSWTVYNYNMLNYVQTGIEKPSGYIWNKLEGLMKGTK